jgi:hypothetical protein
MIKQSKFYTDIREGSAIEQIQAGSEQETFFLVGLF